MLGQDHLHIAAARGDDFGRVRAYLHAFGDRGGARGGEAVFSFDFHDADAAGAYFVQSLELAERRDGDAGFSRGVQDGGPFGDADGRAVDREPYHLTGLPPRSVPMP